MGLALGIDSVALVSEHASPIAPLGGADAGGQNVYVGSLASELAGCGVDVAVYTRRDDPELPRHVRLGPRVVIVHVDAGPPVRLAKDQFLPYMSEFSDGLRRAWRRSRPDVVHAHYWMSGMAAVKAAARLRIPVVQTFHALGATKRRHQGARDSSPAARVAVEAALASTVDAVAATSWRELAELRGCGARPRHAEVVPCGVDTGLFAPSRVAPRSSRRVLALGRLVRRKGVDDVLRALSALPDVQLVVAGGSDGAHDPDGARLRTLAHRLGVADRVELLGPVHHPAVPALMCSTDAVVCVPWYEPFGMVAVEAMACGRPVVVSRVGGLADTVVDGKTGLHVPPRDPARLAAALAALLDDEVRRERLGAAGAERVVNLYTWSRVADALLRLYRRVAERPER